MSTGYIKTGYAPSNVYGKPLVKIDGCSGMLTGLGIADARSRHYFRITLDHRPVIENYPYKNGEDFLCAQPHGNNGMGLNLPFDDKLQVEIRGSAASPLTRFWAAYTLSSSKLEKSYHKTEDGYITEINEFKADEEKKYTVESFVSCEKLSMVTLRKDTVALGQKIEGTIQFLRPVAMKAEKEGGEILGWEYQPYEVSEPFVPLLFRAIGRVTPLYEETTSVEKGVGDFNFVPPEFRGEFEVLTNLDSYANIPATVTIL